MTRRRGPQGPDIRDVKPTRVLLHASVTIDGGTIGSSKELDAIVTAVLRSFERVAHEQGLGYSWGLELRCTNPKRMTQRIEKGDFSVVLPPALNAGATPSEKGTAVDAQDS